MLNSEEMLSPFEIKKSQFIFKHANNWNKFLKNGNTNNM